MSNRDVFLAAAESVQRRGLCKDGYYFNDAGEACTLGHLALAKGSRISGNGYVDISTLPYESLARYIHPNTSITDWNDQHASAEDVILMFKTLAEEAES
jgi:hypothetical protein